MISYIEIDEYVQRDVCFGGGFGVPAHLLGMIDDDCYVGGERGDTRHLSGVGERRCEQDTGYAGSGHQLRFWHGCYADADGSGCDLTFRDIDAFVRFGVRPQFLPGCGHPLDVGFEGIDVYKQGRCREIVDFHASGAGQ